MAMPADSRAFANDMSDAEAEAMPRAELRALLQGAVQHVEVRRGRRAYR